MLKAFESFLFKNINRIREKLVGDFVDRRVNQGVSPIIKLITEMKTEIKSDIKSFDDKVSKLDRKFDKAYAETQLMIWGFRESMGDSLETLCHGALERHFDASGKPHSEVIQKFKAKNAKGQEVEIDVFCKDPATIIECTSILQKDGVKKLEKFLAKKTLMETKFACKFNAAFVAIAINPGVRENAVEFCETHGIEFFDGKYELFTQKWEK